MKLARLPLNVWAVVLLANLWLCQTTLAADAPPSKQGTEAAMTQKVQTLVQSQLKEQSAALETRQSELEKRVLEAELKSIDWWFGALAILTALVAILGAVLPYLMGRKDKELLQSELQNARDLVASIKDNKSKSDEIVSALRDYTSGTTQTSAHTAAVSREAKRIVNDPKASKADKLYARAVLVSEEAEADLAQATRACELWQALTVLDPQDGNAAFNYAYWLQQKFARGTQATAHHWRLVADAYSKADQLDHGTPKNSGIQNNWGIALADAAKVLKDQDLPAARALWKQAGERYELALDIKKDDHRAANNWGNVLIVEMQTIKDRAPGEASGLLAQVQSLLERHRAMSEAGAKKVAYNLACVYALQNQAGLAVEQLEVCRLSGDLESRLVKHWRTDLDLAPIRQSPEYLSWKQQHFSNK